MAWLEQCDVCGGSGFFCCQYRNNPDLNQAAAAACPREGGGPGLLQEFQFFGRPGGGIGWLVDDAKDGEVVTESRTPAPVVPTVWDSECRRGSCSPRWPTLESCSISASSKSPLTEAAVVVGPAASAGAAVPFCGGADASNPDAMEADKTASEGKDESSNMDREARVLRYREKKKRRKFGKQIRYASRKAYAEARPRIRGRFVKAPEVMTPPPVPLPPQYDAEQIGLGWFRAFRP